jgi:hypothetical protein
MAIDSQLEKMVSNIVSMEQQIAQKMREGEVGVNNVQAG